MILLKHLIITQFIYPSTHLHIIFFKDHVQHHDKAWKLIDDKLEIVTWEKLIGENVIREFLLGKCAIFASSYKFE